MELEDKHILLTGASRGIGAALVETLAAAGARVSLVARSEPALAALAAQHGGQIYVCDLGDRAARAGLVARAEAVGGPLDVLINNAGIEASRRLEESRAEEIAEVIEVNLIAAVELTRQVLPGMLARGAGHLVNVSSYAGVVGFPGMASYGAAKAGLSHFTATLRGDLVGTGVKTTLVELGAVATDMLDGVKRHPPAAAAFARVGRLRLMRDVPPEEVARAIALALRRDRAHVRLPRRGAPFSILAELPRRVIERILAGLPRR